MRAEGLSGAPSCPHAAISSSPRLSRTVHTYPSAMRALRKDATAAGVLGANWAPWWGLNTIRLTCGAGSEAELIQ